MPPSSSLADVDHSAPKATAPAAAPEPSPPPEEPTTFPDGAKITIIMRSQINAERAKKLSERFNLPIEPHEWVMGTQDRKAYRVEKPIRMRIHRECHRCGSTFGGSKVCDLCQHTRCTKCPRYPPKKPRDQGRVTETPTPAVMGGTVGGIEADDYHGLREKLELVLPNKRPGGQPLVKKRPMQRVRRTCHECSTLFLTGDKICRSCSHVRCSDCPRDP